MVQGSVEARQVALYDALGEVETLHHGPVGVQEVYRQRLDFVRDPLGAELRRLLPGGIEVLWGRDASGKPTSRRTIRRRPGAYPVEGPARERSGIEELSAWSYQWRGEDQIAAHRENAWFMIRAARGIFTTSWAETFHPERVEDTSPGRSPGFAGSTMKEPCKGER